MLLEPFKYHPSKHFHRLADFSVQHICAHCEGGDDDLGCSPEDPDCLYYCDFQELNNLAEEFQLGLDDFNNSPFVSISSFEALNDTAEQIIELIHRIEKASKETSRADYDRDWEDFIAENNY